MGAWCHPEEIPYLRRSKRRASAVNVLLKEFFYRYETVAKNEVFENRKVLETYCQTNVIVMREACLMFRRHFLQIGNVAVFLGSMTIASACNKAFRKKFLQPDRIGIIPFGCSTYNRKHSKKTIALLILKERKEGNRILHRRKGNERRLPDLPDVRVDGFCEDTHTVYEFNGCYCYGHTCMPFRDLSTACGSDTLAERYEQTVFRLERIKRAGYQVKVQWECEFDFPEAMEAEESLPLRTRDALYGGRTEAMRLYYTVN